LGGGKLVLKNPGKSKAIRFTRAWVKNSLAYSLGDKSFREESSLKYLEIILRSDLSGMDQVNYTTQKAGTHVTS